MISDGDLDVEQVGDHFRWTYTTVNGASWVGARLWKRRQDARRDGRAWLTEQAK